MFVLALGLVACKGSSTQDIAMSDTTERTEAEIINAWRRFGFICEDGKVSMTGTAVVSYTLIGPTLSDDGNWYVGCHVNRVPSALGLQAYCHRVDAETLEVTNVEVHYGTSELSDKPCQDLPGWPRAGSV
jgi:hypothetical protein